MNEGDIKTWLDILKNVFSLFALVAASFWAWSRFVVERGLLPSTQMDISCRTLGAKGAAKLLEIGIRLRNKGSSALVVRNLRLRLRYIDDADEIRVIDAEGSPAFGRLEFFHAHLIDEVGGRERTVTITKGDRKVSLARGEFLVVPYDTFVQPDVEQLYAFATAIPLSAGYLMARASFEYEMHPSKIELGILRLSRKIGMIQYSLDHISKPHTIEKSFNLGTTASREADPA
jgi:hypothetical protein